MTPKEKAKILVDKFSPFVNPYMGSGMLSNSFDNGAILFQSKRCAIVLVDEVISVIPMYVGKLNPDWEFWDMVRKEIKML